MLKLAMEIGCIPHLRQSLRWAMVHLRRWPAGEFYRLPYSDSAISRHHKGHVDFIHVPLCPPQTGFCRDCLTRAAVNDKVPPPIPP